MMKKLFPLLFVFLFAACSENLENEGIDQDSKGVVSRKI